MSGEVNKTLVKQRFAKRLASYEVKAVVQQRIAAELALKFENVAPTHSNSILEVGCGTGFLTREMLQKEINIGKLYLNDIVPSALPVLQKEVKKSYPDIPVYTIEGDAEDIEFNMSADAVLSASTIQWFENLPAFIAKISRMLHKDGIFAFSTFGEGNLFQIKELTGKGIAYVPSDELRQMLTREFKDVDLWEKQMTQTFETPMAVLRHLQETGVTGTGNFRWSRSMLETFSKEYLEKYTQEGKVVLSWHIIYAICKK